jgi:hypothetical protein
MPNRPAPVVNLAEVRRQRERVRPLAELLAGDGLEAQFETLARKIEGRADAMQRQAAGLVPGTEDSRELFAQIAMARASAEALMKAGRRHPPKDSED